MKDNFKNEKKSIFLNDWIGSFTNDEHTKWKKLNVLISRNRSLLTLRLIADTLCLHASVV